MLKLPLRHTADRVARQHSVAGLDAGSKFPIPARNGVKVLAALEEEAALFCQLRQGILQTVVHLRQKAGAKLDAQQLAGQFHLIADLDAVRHFIDLHTRGAAIDADDLALEPISADLDEADFIFSHGAIELCRDKVPVHSGHISCHFFHVDSPVL